jgi:hypothetical protein
MICGKLAKDEVAGGVTVPVARSGQDISEQRGRLVINIAPPEDAEHKPIAGMDPVIYVRAKVVPEDQLVDLLRREVNDNKDLKIMIRADLSYAYKDIAPVLVACARADIRSVNLATTILHQ